MFWRSWTPASAGSAILGYDDLLIRLADALKADDSPAQIRMHRRWPIVMVDEFQDTDPVQWQVIDRAFSGRSTVILIGDPKQAIYAFRGGDIVTYLKAAETAGDKQTLGTNWRSDGALVDRLQVVLRGAELGDPRIVVHDVDAYHRGSRLAGAPSCDPFRLRVVKRETFGRSGIQNLAIDDLRTHIGRDLAADIRALLAGDATFNGEKLEARDIAVIVESHKDARACHRALGEAGVPSVYTGDSDVFGSEAAEDWLALLEAFDQPHRSGVVRAAAATMFFGETAETLACGWRCADRPRRRDAARVGRTCAGARCRRDLRGRAAERHGRPGAVVAGRRAAHDRPGPHDAAVAGGRAPRALQPARAARLAANPARRAQWRNGTQPPAGQ